MNRDRTLDIIQDYLIPHIDRLSEDGVSRSLDEDQLAEVEAILAETYFDEGKGLIKSFLKVLVPLLIIDYLLVMPSQVYGLVFSITGTLMLLVESDILGRHTIAQRSQYSTGATYGGPKRLDRDMVKRLAHNTVMTNISLVWLSIGFFFK